MLVLLLRNLLVTKMFQISCANYLTNYINRWILNKFVSLVNFKLLNFRILQFRPSLSRPVINKLLPLDTIRTFEILYCVHVTEGCKESLDIFIV